MTRDESSPLLCVIYRELYTIWALFLIKMGKKKQNQWVYHNFFVTLLL